MNLPSPVSLGCVRRGLAVLLVAICFLPIPAFAAVTWSSAWTGILDNSSVDITLAKNTDYAVFDGTPVSLLQLNFGAADLAIPANDTTTIVFARKFTVTGSPANVFTQLQSTVNLPGGNTLSSRVVISPLVTPELTYNVSGPNMFTDLTTGATVAVPIGTGSVTWTLTFTSTNSSAPVPSSPFTLSLNGL